MTVDRSEPTPKPGRLSRLLGTVAGAASGAIGGAIGGFRKFYAEGIHALRGSGGGGGGGGFTKTPLDLILLLLLGVIIVGPGIAGLAYGAVAGAVNGTIDGACNGLTAGLQAATRINQQAPDDRFLDYYETIRQRENNQMGSPRYAERLANFVTTTVPNAIMTQLNKLAPTPSAASHILSAPLPANTGILSRIGYGIKGLLTGFATGLSQGWQHERSGNLASLVDGLVFAPLAAIGGGLYGLAKGLMQGNRGIELAQDKIRDYANYERRLMVHTSTKGIQLTNRFAPNKFTNTLIDQNALKIQYPDARQREEALYYIKQEAANKITPRVIGKNDFGGNVYGADVPAVAPILETYAKLQGKPLTTTPEVKAPPSPSSTRQITKDISPTSSVALSQVQVHVAAPAPVQTIPKPAAKVIKAVREPLEKPPEIKTPQAPAAEQPSKFRRYRT